MQQELINDLFDACDAADTAFAVLNISDLTPQARMCVREAWPLVQSARAKAVGGVYAEAVKESHSHEIARLDGLLAEMSLAVLGLLNMMSGRWELNQLDEIIVNRAEAALKNAGIE